MSTTISARSPGESCSRSSETGFGSRPPSLPITVKSRSSKNPKENTRFTEALSSRSPDLRGGDVEVGAVGAVDQHVVTNATGLDLAVAVEALVLHDQRDVVHAVLVRQPVGGHAVGVVEDEHAGQAHVDVLLGLAVRVRV